MSDVSISSQTTAEQRAHEPSMEEILASIRRIIADDQVLPLSRPAQSPEAQSHEVAREPVRETAAVTPAQAAPRHSFPRAATAQSSAPQAPVAPAPAPAAPAAADPGQAARAAVAGLRASLRGSDSLERSETFEDELRAPVRPEPAPRPAARPAAERAPATFNDSDDSGLLSAGADASVSSSFNALATTVLLQNSGMIEDSIREMLRPMLKQWLDDNLPVIVERLVRQEIERVARGRR